MLRGGSDQEMTATSEVMDKARTFSGGWLGTAWGEGRTQGPSQGGATPHTYPRLGPAAQPVELQVRKVEGSLDSVSD